MDEFVILLNRKKIFRMKRFHIPIRNLSMNLSEPLKTILVDADLAMHHLKCTYRNLPKDIYINYVDKAPGYACIEVVASSAEFPIVEENMQIPLEAVD